MARYSQPFLFPTFFSFFPMYRLLLCLSREGNGAAVARPLKAADIAKRPALGALQSKYAAPKHRKKPFAPIMGS